MQKGKIIDYLESLVSEDKTKEQKDLVDIVTGLHNKDEKAIFLELGNRAFLENDFVSSYSYYEQAGLMSDDFKIEFSDKIYDIFSHLENIDFNKKDILPKISKDCLITNKKECLEYFAKNMISDERLFYDINRFIKRSLDFAHTIEKRISDENLKKNRLVQSGDFLFNLLKNIINSDNIYIDLFRNKELINPFVSVTLLEHLVLRYNSSKDYNKIIKISNDIIKSGISNENYNLISVGLYFLNDIEKSDLLKDFTNYIDKLLYNQKDYFDPLYLTLFSNKEKWNNSELERLIYLSKKNNSFLEVFPFCFKRGYNYNNEDIKHFKEVLIEMNLTLNHDLIIKDSNDIREIENKKNFEKIKIDYDILEKKICPEKLKKIAEKAIDFKDYNFIKWYYSRIKDDNIITKFKNKIISSELILDSFQFKEISEIIFDSKKEGFYVLINQKEPELEYKVSLINFFESYINNFDIYDFNYVFLRDLPGIYEDKIRELLRKGYTHNKDKVFNAVLLLSNIRFVRPSIIKKIASDLKNNNEEILSNKLIETANYIASFSNPLDFVLNKDPRLDLYNIIEKYLRTDNLFRLNLDLSHEFIFFNINDIDNVEKIFSSYNLYYNDRDLIRYNRIDLSKNLENNILSYSHISRLNIAGKRKDYNFIKSKIKKKIKNNDYSNISFYLTLLKSEDINKIISEPLKQDIIDKLKKNPIDGINFLVNLARSELGDKFEFKLSNENYKDGYSALGVSKVDISSSLFGLNLALKIDYSENQKIEIESILYEHFYNKGFNTPKLLALGKKDNLSVAAYENIESIPLSELFKNPEVEFKGKKYNINRDDLVKRVFIETNKIREELSTKLNEIEFNDKTLEEYLLVLQKNELESYEKLVENELDLKYLRMYKDYFNNNSLVWCKDIKAANWGYNPELDKLCIFDFNHIYRETNLGDAAKFIESDGISKDYRDRIIDIFLEMNPELSKNDYELASNMKKIWAYYYFKSKGNKDMADKRIKQLNHIYFSLDS
jgi:hypothetical protein